MKLEDALPLMREGRWFRRPCWKPKRRVTISGQGNRPFLRSETLWGGDAFKAYILSSVDVFADDWEEYQPEEPEAVEQPEEGLVYVMGTPPGSFEWALARLREGRAVRRSGWTEGTRMVYGHDEIIMSAPGLRDWAREFGKEELEATDWEVVE